jgi:hypothetical protein
MRICADVGREKKDEVIFMEMNYPKIKTNECSAFATLSFFVFINGKRHLSPGILRYLRNEVGVGLMNVRQQVRCGLLNA